MLFSCWIRRGFAVLIVAAMTVCTFGQAKTVPVTLLHTNDLHSHFRSRRNALGLGGVARLKTLTSSIRRTNPNTFLVDGGDWSEGNIYYTEGTGGENLKMMDHLGYDAAVLGNHDWLNGPDVLLNAIANARSKVALLAANADPTGYKREAEFRKRIQPYLIREFDGVRIAFIGVITFELIYDKYFRPIAVNELLFSTRRLSSWLKKKMNVDAVIAISHNSILANEVMLKFAPAVDLVVAGHDHVKLMQPKVVKRWFARDAWIVEAGSWGDYLGRVSMLVTPHAEAKRRKIPTVQLTNYKLIQVDASIPEDPETLTRIEALEREIERTFGPIFSDHIGDSEVEITRKGLESAIGNLATESYRVATNADVAFDNIHFVYGEIPEGPIHTADVFNANPGVFNPETGKTWTLKVLPLNGLTLQWLMDIAFSPLFGRRSVNSIVSTSGLSLEVGRMRLRGINGRGESEVVANDLNFVEAGDVGDQEPSVTLDPIMGARGLLPFELPLLKGPVQDGWETSGLTARGSSWNPLSGWAMNIKIGGVPLNPLKTYKVAMSSAFFESLTILNSFFRSRVPVDGWFDTGIEAWRSMRDHISRSSPITSAKLNIGKHFLIRGSDLGILNDDVRWVPNVRTAAGTLARIEVRVRNFGLNPSVQGARINLFTNRNGSDLSTEPDLVPLSKARVISVLKPGQEAVFHWDSVLVPDHLGLAAVTAVVAAPTKSEANLRNNLTTRFFRIPAILSGTSVSD